jgi:hypothetical protein
MTPKGQNIVTGLMILAVAVIGLLAVDSLASQRSDERERVQHLETRVDQWEDFLARVVRVTRRNGEDLNRLLDECADEDGCQLRRIEDADG